MTPRVVFVAIALLAACSGSDAPEIGERDEFSALMERVAVGWNEGDARGAADCFTEDAVYGEPPDKQLFRGREALFEFFGGDSGRDREMHMEWHHLAYDPDTKIGFGEFSFTFGTPSHGVVVVKVRDGMISRWREYYYDSDLPWTSFTAHNPF